MNEISVVIESFKRHVLKIILITALAAGLSLAWGVFSSSDGEASSYSAEATIYVTAYATDTINDYNFSYSDDKLISDSRRIVVSNEVAGKVREKYDGNVTITSPQWNGTLSSNNVTYTRFIFVDATAESKEVALDAANEAASLAADVINSTIENATVVNVGEAAIRVPGKEAANFGTDALDGTDAFDEAVVDSESGINKKIMICAVLAFFGSAFIFAMWDILTRRVRSERDVQRIFDVRLLGSVDGEASLNRAADEIKVIAEKNDVKKLALVTASSFNDTTKICDSISSQIHMDVEIVEVAADSHACSKIANADASVILVEAGKDSARLNSGMVDALVYAESKVIGAVFVPKTAVR